MNKTALVLSKKIYSKILFLRGQRVMLDTDLAAPYGVSVKQLNQQVKRNSHRFPPDFGFRLSHQEYDNLRSQIVTSSLSHGGSRYLPHAFTEHGAIMAATVLNSKRAVDMSIFVVRAFVRIREAVLMKRQIASKFAELERHLETHDAEIQELVEAIRELMAPLPSNHRRIGFEIPSGSAKGQNRRLKVHQMQTPRPA